MMFAQNALTLCVSTFNVQSQSQWWHFPDASHFNQITAMDLHEIDHNFYYLHIVDLFIRLSAEAIIRRRFIDSC